MTIFFDFLVILSSLYIIVEKTDLLPELLDMLRGYGSLAVLFTVGIFAIKYGIYAFHTFQDVRYARMADPEDEKYGYIKLAVYPACDLLRYFMVLGLLSAFLNGLLSEQVVFNVFVDYFIYVGILMIALFVDYFCRASETIRANLISTGILIVGVMVFSKDLILRGLSLL